MNDPILNLVLLGRAARERIAGAHGEQRGQGTVEYVG